MDESQFPPDSRALAPNAEHEPGYDDHEVGYEAANPALQGGFGAGASGWHAEF